MTIGVPVAALLTLAALSGSVDTQRVPTDALSKAYWKLLDERRCAIIQPSEERLAIFEEIDRTDRILLEAGRKGLAKRLRDAAANWQAFDATADKICSFQTPGQFDRVVDSMRRANDALEIAVRESSGG